VLVAIVKKRGNTPAKLCEILETLDVTMLVPTRPASLRSPVGVTGDDGDYADWLNVSI
jgi:hypothetical protein